jgi:hypothetical protein
MSNKTTILVKFICAVLFHFKFETEIRGSLTMMRYVALHYEDFENPNFAFLICMINMAVIYVVEFVNLWNLSNITEGTYRLMFNFIPLAIISEFDDYFVEIYRYSKLGFLISDLSITFENVRRPKRSIPSVKQFKLEKLMVKIGSNLKEFNKVVLGKTHSSTNSDVGIQ